MILYDAISARWRCAACILRTSGGRRQAQQLVPRRGRIACRGWIGGRYLSATRPTMHDLAHRSAAGRVRLLRLSPLSINLALGAFGPPTSRRHGLYYRMLVAEQQLAFHDLVELRR